MQRDLHARILGASFLFYGQHNEIKNTTSCVKAGIIKNQRQAIEKLRVIQRVVRGCIGLGFGQTAFLSAAAEAGEHVHRTSHKQCTYDCVYARTMYTRPCVCTHRLAHVSTLGSLHDPRM